MESPNKITHITKIADDIAQSQADDHPNMKIYALAKSMKASREYSKREFIIDAISQVRIHHCSHRRIPWIKIDILGENAMEYHISINNPQLISTGLWLAWEGSARSSCRQYRGLLLKDLDQDESEPGDIIVLVDVFGKESRQSKSILILERITRYHHILTRIAPQSEHIPFGLATTDPHAISENDYDLDVIINGMNHNVAASALACSPACDPNNIITIVDQHWPMTPAIITLRHHLVRATAKANGYGDMIVLDLSSPISDSVAKYVECILAEDQIQISLADILPFQELFIFAEIMRALDIHF